MIKANAAHLGIELRPCDEEGCSDCKAVEAEEIHISAVHDVYSANAKFSVSSLTGYFKVLRQKGAQVALVLTRVAEEACAGFVKPVK